MNQRVQEGVISDFRSGKYNILVATSIAEEGLDVGGTFGFIFLCFNRYCALFLLLHHSPPHLFSLPRLILSSEVDLIVCFDATSSPIRMIQRMGRTGRKRMGRAVILVTKVPPFTSTTSYRTSVIGFSLFIDC